MLRRFTEADLDLLVELDSDPEVMRFITGGRATPREEVESEVLPTFLSYYRRFDGYGFWAAIERGAVPSLGGFISVRALGHHETSLNWVTGFAHSASDKGYATEGSRGLSTRHSPNWAPSSASLPGPWR